MLTGRPPRDLKVQTGFSLVELLIALFLGSLLLLMVISLYVSTVASATSNIKMSRLRAELQSLAMLITTDIRRAGAGGDAFLVGVNRRKSVDINMQQNCLVYYYDHDNSEQLESNNKMAFALIDNAVKFKSNVAPLADSTCANTSGWTRLSDNHFMHITELVFTDTAVTNGEITVRNVHFKLTAELVGNKQFHHTVSVDVQIRNIERNE